MPGTVAETLSPQSLKLSGKTWVDHYVSIIQQAFNKITGFSELYKELERRIRISISGKSQSTFVNYSCQLAHLAQHYEQLPTELNGEQATDYLHLLNSRGPVSATFLKFNVYRLRYVGGCGDLNTNSVACLRSKEMISCQ